MSKFETVFEALDYATTQRTKYSANYPLYREFYDKAIAAFHARGNEIRATIADPLDRDRAYVASRHKLDADLIAAVEIAWPEEVRS